MLSQIPFIGSYSKHGLDVLDLMVLPSQNVSQDGINKLIYIFDLKITVRKKYHRMKFSPNTRRNTTHTGWCVTITTVYVSWCSFSSVARDWQQCSNKSHRKHNVFKFVFTFFSFKSQL